MQSPIRRFALRLIVALILSLTLGLFLWGIQLSLEAKEVPAWKKFSLFVLTIYGAGFSWDAVKRVITLPQQAFDRFTHGAVRSLCWFAAYWFFGVFFLLLLGPLAGWATIFSVVVLLLALAAGYKALQAFGLALDAAIDEPSP